MNGWHLIEVDLDNGAEGYARDGQKHLERYLAKVAALDVWVAAHPNLRGAP